MDRTHDGGPWTRTENRPFDGGAGDPVAAILVAALATRPLDDTNDDRDGRVGLVVVEDSALTLHPILSHGSDLITHHPLLLSGAPYAMPSLQSIGDDSIELPELLIPLGPFLGIFLKKAGHSSPETQPGTDPLHTVRPPRRQSLQ